MTDTLTATTTLADDVRAAGANPVVADVETLDVQEVLAGICVEPIDGLGTGPWAQLWPHRHGTDAMFAAYLRRRSPSGSGST